jgi:hypothetical protein
LERRLGKAAKDGSGLPKLTGQIQWDANSPLAGTLVDIAPFGAGDLWTSASAAAPQPKPPKKPPGKKPSPAGTGTLPIGILVTDSKTYNRIKGAKVRLGTVTKRTNESGHAEFDVAEGAYACEVSADGYGGKTETVKARTATDEFEFALDPVSEKQSAAGDDTVQVDIVVVEPDEASQKNNAILGTPIKRATVELVAGAKTYKKGANTTGQVSFRVPPGSDVKCKASAAGYETAEKTFYVPHDGPRSFDIQLKRTPIADPVADQWWETDEGYVPLIVDVREFEGAAKPIQGAIVRIDADPFLTDGEGRVTRDLSVQSTWEYEISAPGYKTEKGTFEITDKRKHLEVFLARTAKTVTTGDMVVVQVVVHNRLGDMLTVKNAVVTVGRVSRKTDSSGMATFSVPPGVHEFAVRMKGYSDETGKFDVPTSKDAITQRIAITPSTKPVENICVRVREAGTHTPVVKAAVRISSQQESTDAQGVARFLEMPLGALDLAVAAAGYKTHSRTFHHNRQFATEFLEIELEPDRATGASPKPMEPRE